MVGRQVRRIPEAHRASGTTRYKPWAAQLLVMCLVSMRTELQHGSKMMHDARHERHVKGALHAGDLEQQLLDLLHTGRPQQPAQEGAPALAGAAGNAAAPGGGAALRAEPAVAALQQTRDRLRQLADALTGGAPSSEAAAAPQAASPSAGQQQQEPAAQQQQSQAPAAGTDVTATPQAQQPAAEVQLRAALGRSMPPAGGLAGDDSLFAQQFCECVGQKCSACGTACKQHFLCCTVSVWTPFTSLTNDSLCTGAGAVVGSSAPPAALAAGQTHSAGLGQVPDPAGQPGRAPLITSDLFGSAMQAAMSSLEHAAPQVMAVRGVPCFVS